jgi:hypothetical protein
VYKRQEQICSQKYRKDMGGMYEATNLSKRTVT